VSQQTPDPKIKRKSFQNALLFIPEWVQLNWNQAPALHRLNNALGLTIGLYIGRKMMDIIVGQHTDGTPVDANMLPAPLRSIHGIMPYDHFSDAPEHRWLAVVDKMMPAILGGMGAIAGSAFHFHKRIKTLEKEIAEYQRKGVGLSIDLANEKAVLESAKFWRMLSGGFSIFGSASGLALLPINYGNTLGFSFTMAMNNRIASGIPGLSKITDTPGIYPYGPGRLLDTLLDYESKNPSIVEGQKLESMVDQMLKMWFNNVSESQVRTLVERIKTIKEQAKKGHNPDEWEKAIKDSLRQHFTRDELTKELMDIGLDARYAGIGDRGVATLIPRIFGFYNNLKKIEKEAFDGTNRILKDYTPNGPGV
jgi:hypothetical protein